MPKAATEWKIKKLTVWSEIPPHSSHLNIMATNNRYITSNFTPAEPDEFKKWCSEKKINIHETGYGKNVYLTTNKTNLANEPRLVRFTKDDNCTFRTVMLCEIKFKGNELMGSEMYTINDDGIKRAGSLIYFHNMQRFFNAIMEQTK